MKTINLFPTEVGDPRPQQVKMMTAFDSTNNDIVYEANVGVGKSAFAIAASRSVGDAIINVPGIQLQRQYHDDFPEVALLVGRSRFPCLKKDPNAVSVISVIKKGVLPKQPLLENSCASGPCLGRPLAKRQRIMAECDAMGGCPVNHAIDRANEQDIVISNLYSLLYSVSLTGKVRKRKLLIFDECHNLASTLRQFMSVKMTVRRQVDDVEVRFLKTTEQWLQFLSLPQQLSLMDNEDMLDSYKSRLEKMKDMGNSVQNYYNDPDTGFLKIEFIPTSVSGAARSLLFSLADRIVFMSGTIYSLPTFLQPLGLDEDKVKFVRVASDFPVDSRLIYLPKSNAPDLSYKGFEQNLPILVDEIKQIMNKHKDSKGIIHCNSYRMADTVTKAVGSPRMIRHDSDSFIHAINDFYDREDNSVFVSPSVSEGHSFDYDLARWQIIITPKFAPVNDAYTKYLLDNGRWDIYFMDAMKVLGQQFGRIVRSSTDEGTTYLISSGFNKLLERNFRFLPKYLKESFRTQE